MPPLRILLVDDTATHRALWRRAFLETWPHAAIEDAPDAAAALERMRGASFDVIVSDHHMPAMSGVELLEIARREHPATLRVLVTAEAEFSVAHAAIQKARVHGFLEKKEGARVVRERVGMLLGQRPR